MAVSEVANAQPDEEQRSQRGGDGQRKGRGPGQKQEGRQGHGGTDSESEQ